MTRLLRVLLATTAAIAAGGCVNLSQLQFKQDHRLHFTSPDSRAQVQLPVTLSWTMGDFRVAARGSEAPSEHAGYFAVFVDRAPVKPGQTLAVVAKGDPTCRPSEGCPDAAYLRLRGVYTTTAPSLVLRNVVPITSNNDHVQLHEATVVLMDTSGRRIGESAWYRDFKLERVGY